MTLYSIEPPIVGNSLIGAGSGGLIYFLSSIFPSLSLALPVLPFALGANAIIILGVAPIVETLFFEVLLLSLLVTFLKKFWLANIIHALIFMIYHTQAYAKVLQLQAILGVSMAFISAFFVSITLGYLTKKFGALSAWACHLTLNAITFVVVYSLVTIG